MPTAARPPGPDQNHRADASVPAAFRHAFAAALHASCSSQGIPPGKQHNKYQQCAPTRRQLQFKHHSPSQGIPGSGRQDKYPATCRHTQAAAADVSAQAKAHQYRGTRQVPAVRRHTQAAAAYSCSKDACCLGSRYPGQPSGCGCSILVVALPKHVAQRVLLEPDAVPEEPPALWDGRGGLMGGADGRGTAAGSCGWGSR